MRRETKAEREDREIAALEEEFKTAIDRFRAALSRYETERRLGGGVGAEAAFAEMEQAGDAQQAAARVLTDARLKRSDRLNRERWAAARKAKRVAAATSTDKEG